MSKFTFWVGWEASHDIPQEHMVASWPKGMKGWCSGSSDEFETYAGRVDADDAKKAKALVRSCYGASGDKIVMRWEPEQHELGWRPTGGRFPE